MSIETGVRFWLACDHCRRGIRDTESGAVVVFDSLDEVATAVQKAAEANAEQVAGDLDLTVLDDGGHLCDFCTPASKQLEVEGDPLPAPIAAQPEAQTEPSAKRALPEDGVRVVARLDQFATWVHPGGRCLAERLGQATASGLRVAVDHLMLASDDVVHGPRATELLRLIAEAMRLIPADKEAA